MEYNNTISLEELRKMSDGPTLIFTFMLFMLGFLCSLFGDPFDEN